MLTRRLIAALAIIVTVTPALALQAARGTREEAVAMVERAQALYREQGEEALLTAVMDLSDQRFHDRDLYVWVLDFDMVMLAHGTKPALAGKNVSRLTDYDGVKVSVEAVNIARQDGTGWFSYRWQNPISGTVDKKQSYIVNVSDELIIGVGVYDD